MKKIITWTQQVTISHHILQDQFLLTLYHQVNCFQKWKFISEKFLLNGYKKNQAQCRQRFVNKLNPQLRKDKLSSPQLKLLFEYYDEYGPLWSIFQTLIPGRTQNLLKNKFYSTLRTLVRTFITHSQKNLSQPFYISSNQLSSKLLVQIYQGKKNFNKFKGLLKSILHKTNFQLNSNVVHLINNQTIFQIVSKIKKQLPEIKKPTHQPSSSKNTSFIKKSSNSNNSFNQTDKIDKIDTTDINISKITQQQLPSSSPSFQLIPISTPLFFLQPSNYTYFLPLWPTI